MHGHDLHDPSSCSTLLDLLEVRASQRPQSDLYIEPTIGGEGHAHRARAHHDFAQRARAIAGALQAHAPTGARVLICLPNGIEYLEAFFACVCAGMIAVPVFPPHARRAQPQLVAISHDSEPHVILTNGAHRAACEAFVQRAQLRHEPRVLDLTDLPSQAPWTRPDLHANSIALLQYTSGSTADPKGVILTHGNVLANQRAIAELVGLGGCGVSWLPLHHDMGLGSALAALYCAGSCVVFQPFQFATHPRSWLEVVTRYRARVSAAPNFAFEHCIERIADSDLEGLDLSSWQAAIVGAEPVRPQTLRAFANKFSQVGFDIRAFRPSYGMAESTLLVTGEPTARAPFSKRVSSSALERGQLAPPESNGPSRELISCGKALSAHRVIVVDPDTRRIREAGRVGEVWVSGPSVSAGYWQKPKETADTFGARTPDLDGVFLRTGDLGVEHDGEIFVTGRLKDMLIVRGRNYYPQDIELVAERTSTRIVPHVCTVFSVDEDDGQTFAALVCEVVARTTEVQLEGLVSALREKVQATCDLALDVIAFVKRGALPLTTSGKVQRRQTRALLREGKLPLLGIWAREGAAIAGLANAPKLSLGSEPFVSPASEEERVVAQVWKDALGVARVGLYDSFFDLGGHSMRALEIIQRVNAHFGVRLHYKDLYETPTVDGMVQAIRDAQRAPRQNAALDISSTSATRFPLTLAQRRIWDAFERVPTDTGSNITAATHISGPLNREALSFGLSALLARHPALRTRFERDELGAVWQCVESRTTVELCEHDLSGLDPASRSLERQRLVGLELLRPFDLRVLPLFRALLLRHGPEDHELLFVINHIVGDGWSLSILERELRALYHGYIGGQAPTLPEVPATYADYVRWLDAYTSDPERRGRASAFWERRLSGQSLAPARLPYDFPDAYDPTDTKTSAFRAVLSERATHRIRAIAHNHGATSFVLLFSALARFLSEELRQPQLILGIPSANRHVSEHLGVFGYFVDPVFVPIDVRAGEPFLDLLSRVGHEVFTSLEWSPFPIEFVCQLKGAQCPGLRTFHIWYNMTTFGDMARRTLMDRDARHSPIGPDSKFDFSIYPSEYENGIEINAYYKRALYRAETIERAVLGFVKTLEELT